MNAYSQPAQCLWVRDAEAQHHSNPASLACSPVVPTAHQCGNCRPTNAPRRCVGCFSTTGHYEGCPTGQNGTPNYE